MGLDGGFPFWAAQGQSRVEGNISSQCFFPLEEARSCFAVAQWPEEGSRGSSLCSHPKLPQPLQCPPR